jgi:hypothetical protein
MRYQLRKSSSSCGKQHGISILASLALLDVQHHALGVDVVHLQTTFGDAQPCIVGDTQCALYLMLGAASSIRATSSGLNTTGSLRASYTNEACLARSARSSSNEPLGQKFCPGGL